MAIQAIVDIDVDVDFGLARALRICQGCGARNITSDSIRRSISMVIVKDVEDKIRCLSIIKGFFTVDLRLVIELCNLDNNTLKVVGITPVPRGVAGRILGYTHLDNKLCVFVKTSKKNVVIARILRSKNIPVFLEPSAYLIQAPSEEILNKVLDVLNTLKILENRLSMDIAKVCPEQRRA